MINLFKQYPLLTMDSSYLLLMFLCVVNCEWNTNDYLKREHSLMKPYTGKLQTRNSCCLFQGYHNFSPPLGSGLSMPFWDFLGSTVVSSNYIRLTSDLQSKSGAIWNIVVNSACFFISKITFLIHSLYLFIHSPANLRTGNSKSSLKYMDMAKISLEMD